MNCRGRARYPRHRYAGGIRSVNRLDETDVCAACGTVAWFGQMHQCRPRSAPENETARHGL